MSRDQITMKAGPRAVITETVPSQDSQDPSTPLNSTPLLCMTPNEVPRPQTSRDQTTIEAGHRAGITERVSSQKSQEPSAPFHLTPLLSLNPHEASRPKRGRATLETERALPLEHDSMVVITKKRRIRGITIPKILVRWRHFTIP